MNSMLALPAVLLLYQLIPLCSVVLLVFHVLSTRKQRDQAILIDYLASVTARGYPPGDGLAALAAGCSGRFSRALTGASDSLSHGAPLSDALNRFPRLMSREYLDLVHAGETAGRLPDVFQVLRRSAHRDHGQRAKLCVLALYPVLLLFACAGMYGLWMLRLYPLFYELARDFDMDIDALVKMRMVLLLTVFMMLVVIAAMLLLVLALPASRRLRREKQVGIIDALKWWLPVSRGYEKCQGIALFAQSLQMQLAGAVPFRQALETACQVTTNVGVRRRLGWIGEWVNQGKPLSQAAELSGLFPNRLVHLLAMGEAGNDVVPALKEIVAASQGAMERIVNWAWAIIVPVTVVVTGLTVACLATFTFRCLVNLMRAIL